MSEDEMPANLGEQEDPDEPGSVDLSPFVHPAEADFAAFLDFYRIRWQYEPRSFALRWRDGRIAQMFTPDFYLPEQDLYVELTTMKQSLVTRKNRKIRRLRELYPTIKVVLLNRKGFHELLSRFGYGAVDITSLSEDDIEWVLFSQSEIQQRVQALGRQISTDYAGESLVLVGLLKGVTFFLADLARAITRPLVIDYLSVANPDDSPDGVHFERDLDYDIHNRHVILIEDIVNTGFTMDFVLEHLRARGPASLSVCALLDKAERRIVPVDLRYVGFQIPNEYVVGYGLDHRELYRNLPFICVLKRSTYEDDETVGIEAATTGRLE
ncbi:MAG TPA: hypoxanthine phosphoribosyltransferase [Thermomicrobiales bacterium]|nr:hypoxanthine phosphoribosyltransferase [Thermomicrobiales bacterium]HRA33153.1 hypoxanthine phosphoribosyltransferase [Thermomicrobiales bacterium]